MQFTRNKRALIGGGIFILCLALIGFIAISTQKYQKTHPKVSEYKDPDSGETVSNIEGKTPELGDNKDVLLLGFYQLLDNGTTKYQLNAAQNTITDYAKKNNIKEISLKVDSIQYRKNDPAVNKEAEFTTEFLLKFDRKPAYYKTTVDSIDLTTVRVRIYDEKGTTLLYDSGRVGDQVNDMSDDPNN